MDTSELSCQKISYLELNNLIRRLWEDHVFWTRLLIISIANNLPDVQPVSRRLLRNATDFQQLFTYFYGFEIGREFGALMTAHLVIAEELVVAAKAHDKQKVALFEKKWYRNAEEIAIFLSRINFFWRREKIEEMMFTHLRLTEEEALAILTVQSERSIVLFDEIETQVLMMADTYIKGFAKQFPYIVTESH